MVSKTQIIIADAIKLVRDNPSDLLPSITFLMTENNWDKDSVVWFIENVLPNHTL